MSVILYYRYPAYLKNGNGQHVFSAITSYYIDLENRTRYADICIYEARLSDCLTKQSEGINLQVYKFTHEHQIDISLHSEYSGDPSGGKAESVINRSKTSTSS